MNKYTADDFIVKDRNLICTKCNHSFIRKISGCAVIKNKSILCDKCIREKISNTMKYKNNERLKSTPYELLGILNRKKIIWEEQGKKCNNCGYNLYDLSNGPYELHHKDERIHLPNRNNEEILCCNCHNMTSNHRFKNRKHSIQSIKIIIDKRNNIIV